MVESFESRFSRLTPEQQKEVEDFMDFLLLKNTLRQGPVVSQPPPMMLNTPPVMVPDPAIGVQRIPRPAQVPGTPAADPSSFPPINDTDSPPMHEITAGDEDWISRDYMDYGKFEPQPSPATEAVRKVKQKIITREEQDKSKHLLDWVD
jgi:hypothetical protein